MAIETFTNLIKQDGSDFIQDFMACFDENGTLISRERTEHCFWLISQFLSVNMIDNYYQQKITKINGTLVKLKEVISKEIKGNWDCQMVEIYFRIKELYIKKIGSITPQNNIMGSTEETYPMGMGKTTYNNNYSAYKD